MIENIQNFDEVDKIREEEDKGSENVVTLERYDVTYYSIEKSISQLLKWKKDHKLIIPDFQRDFCWKKEKACLLIDSVIMNLPIPNIFVYREINDEKKEVYRLIDGKQRLTTFDMFVKGKFKDEKKDFRIDIISNSTWSKKTYNELEEDDKSAFDEYPINITVFENVSNIDDNKKKQAMIQIFHRVNTGAEALSMQEIRNAICQGKALNIVKEYLNNQDSSFNKLCEKDDKIQLKYTKDEVLFRILAYKKIYDELLKGNDTNKYSKSDTITNYISWANLNIDEFNNQFLLFKLACDTIYKFNENAFYNVNRKGNDIGNRVHDVFSEALVISTIIKNDFIGGSKEDFNNKKIDIWNNEEKKLKFVANTLSNENIIARIKIVSEFI